MVDIMEVRAEQRTEEEKYGRYKVVTKDRQFIILLFYYNYYIILYYITSYYIISSLSSSSHDCIKRVSVAGLGRKS